MAKKYYAEATMKIDGTTMAAFTQLLAETPPIEIPSYRVPLPKSVPPAIHHSGEPTTPQEREIDRVLNAISLNHFPLPIRLRWEFERGDVRLHVTMRTKERVSGNPIKVQSICAMSVFMFENRSHAMVIDMVHRELQRLILHELDEHFIVNGARIFEPHKEESP